MKGLMNAENQYLKLVEKVLTKGVYRKDRTGVGCYSLFGENLRHDYSEGFPLLTTKKMFVRGAIIELLWFLKGTENPNFLLENNVHIWDEWMKKDENGNPTLPKTYGVQWRNFGGKVDQIAKVIHKIKTDPSSRRLLVVAWNPVDEDEAALPWCHVLFQFDVELDEDKPHEKRIDDGKKGDISISVYKRSCDIFLGIPVNLASYSYLLYMIAEVTGYRPKSMYYTFGNLHVYSNHVEQCKLQLTRNPYKPPNVRLNHRDDIDDFVLEDFSLDNYECHPVIKAPVAV